MKIKQWFQRPLSITLSIILAGTGLLPLLIGGSALASGEVQSRSIEMSNSAVGASGTSYSVNFTTATTGTVAGIVVDFCASSPIISSACTAPTGFTVGTPTVTGQSADISTLTTATSANAGRTLELTGTGASITAPAVVSFTLTTATNPTTTGTFYARIFTFATSAAVTTWAATTDGSSTTGVVDDGGIALSTVAVINVTAKVQEELTFCVFTNAAANCSTASGNSVTLGDNHGVLSNSGPFVDKNTQYIVQTNAGSGATIRLEGNTLTSGSNSIAPMGATAVASSPGTSQFGLCNYTSSGVVVPQAPYNNSGCSSTTQTAGTATPGGNGTALFAFNTTNTLSTYGDVLAQASAGAQTTGTVPMIGNISLTQQAGIYQTALTFIATGTY